jgi:hypothetical protein
VLSGIGLDVSRWPVVIVTPPASVSNEQLDHFFAAFDREVVSKRRRYSIVLDLRRCQGMPAAQRKILTDRMQRGEDRARMFCVGSALVFESALLRSLLTAIMWVREPPNPVKVFATVDEAAEWAMELLDETKVA